ncbi:MAG: HAD hydrolase family protein [Acidobacteriota bacterium]
MTQAHPKVPADASAGARQSFRVPPPTPEPEEAQPAPAIVFTDLDETLLDSRGRVCEASRRALGELAELGVPVVPVTSQSAAEVRKLREDLRLEGPYVVENGSSLHDWPIAGTSIVWGPSYGEVREAFEDLKKRYPIVGFGDHSAASLAKLCQMDVHAAERARDRSSSEPFILVSACDLEQLHRDAEDRGFQIASGGRFFCLQGGQVSQGRAIRKVLEACGRESDGGPVSIGIGNAPNDLSMLRAVSIPVLMPGHCLSLAMRSTLPRARVAGERTWGDIVRHTLAGVLHAPPRPVDPQEGGARV